MFTVCALIDISKAYIRNIGGKWLQPMIYLARYRSNHAGYNAYVQKLDSPFYSLYDPYGQLGSTEESKARRLGTLLPEHKDSRQSLIQDHQIPYWSLFCSVGLRDQMSWSPWSLTWIPLPLLWNQDQSTTKGVDMKPNFKSFQWWQKSDFSYRDSYANK